MAKKALEKNSEQLIEFLSGRKYFEAVGRRKESSALVRIYPKKEKDKPIFVVNNILFEDYFKDELIRRHILSPLTLVGLENNFDISVKVHGGGLKGQADAIKLAIARAIVEFDKIFRPTLKKAGFLTCDSRQVERKKYGLHKARRAHQFRKR